MLTKMFFIICILIFSSSIFTTNSSHTKCLPHQKSLLLQLRNELEFDSSASTKLVRWNQTDECCKWYGVECDAAGHVVSLQLDGEAIEGGIGDSSSLFRLVYLQKLNLANIDLGYTNPIPRGIHNLTYLTHLNLSNAGFGGQLPAEVLCLRKLVSLDISGGDIVENFDGTFTRALKLEYPNLEMLVQNLTGLTELYLDGVNITSSYERRKWSHIISTHLPNLTSLSLSYCDLYGPLSKSFSQLHSLSILRLDGNDLSRTAPDMFANFSSLTTLSLSRCHLKGSFPNMIFHIPTLKYLDLSSNYLLSGSIPPFTQTQSLEFINVGYTNFSGSIPSSINNLKTLSHIDLFFCQFTGSIPLTFANLTELSYVDLSRNLFTGSLSSALFEGLSGLVHLDLGYNSFTGYIPQSLFGLPLLSELDLSGNKFSGQVDEFHIVNVSNIVILDLSDNRLEGSIPDSFSQLKSLESLWLSENLFNNTFQLDKFHSCFSNLTLLDLSDNNLSINSSTSRYGFPRLERLFLASCNISDFPDFIKHSDMISQLDLSNNRISGEIPSWIWGKPLGMLNLSFNLLIELQTPYNISASLYELDLRSNKLRGEMHLLIPSNITYWLSYLLLGNNSFSGSIPTSLCSATNLEVLDLSVNKLSGSIPSYLFENTLNLAVLDLHNNNLEGKIPKSLKNCLLMEFMNVGSNMINDTFPCMLSSSLHVLLLHSNKFHGEVRCHNSWLKLQVLDISSNSFSGSLESINFSSWSGMVVESEEQMRLGYSESKYYSWISSAMTLIIKGLDMPIDKILPEFNAIDFSSNNFTGEIPNALGDLTSLHALNFSHNALNGSIPKSFGQLSKLKSLDLSRNQLTGRIPGELGGLTFLEVLNVSYNNLVGRIPDGRQLQTFSADSFKGNPGLCGFNLIISCNHADGNDLSPPKHENVKEKREIEWEYVSAALGYFVGLGSVVWLLLFCRSFREKYFGKIEEIVEDKFHARDMRRRRARRAMRDQRNRVRRQ